uniref:hypothetical protein n=1 Tax=Parerythrobacter lutipelagi TaxID=1964208 RepID=UPI0010F6C491|nr:hypothetical protein [Parerythrobacter lutipelagi]
MADYSVLAKFVDEDPSDFSGLVDCCGNFIDAWLAAGGEPSDEAIEGFYSIWSQSLDLEGREELAKQEADFYAWAFPYFIRDREEIREALKVQSKKP